MKLRAFLCAKVQNLWGAKFLGFDVFGHIPQTWLDVGHIQVEQFKDNGKRIQKHLKLWKSVENSWSWEYSYVQNFWIYGTKVLKLDLFGHISPKVDKIWVVCKWNNLKIMERGFRKIKNNENRLKSHEVKSILICKNSVFMWQSA